ncbi:MAG TPA: C25 family peptidase propeptide domain-containing protein, partial [Ignavibacteria bacterium]|nr:C25 family peptidase propeptide domain-containing protein [Ignavibacteria bacterium]
MKIQTGKILLTAILSVLFICNFSFAQNDQRNNSKTDSKTITKPVDDTKKVQSVNNSANQNVNEPLKNVIDYNIISSNAKGIEIEYFPSFDNSNNTINTLADVSHTGAPEVAYRPFPVFLPSRLQNTIEIVDVKYEEINNIDLKPVPSISRDKDKFAEFVYTKDDKIYGTNKFYPEKSAYLETGSYIRDKNSGIIKIYPAIYNPVTRTLKRIKYIRVKVNFGSSPVLMKSALSKEERSFLINSALNWKEGLNWTVDTK